MRKPDYIFEASWEVCNKVGGIYTVLSSKACTLQKDFPDRVIFIGPDLGNNPVDFKEDGRLFSDWQRSLPQEMRVRTGRWCVPGEPIVMLVSFRTFFDRRDTLFYEIWEHFGVDSSRAYGDYDESCIFAYSTALFIESFHRFHHLDTCNVVAHFNEWMLGMGVLYLLKHLPRIATVFTTHATTIGRSIAGNGKLLYRYMYGYHGDQMARELNVESKHSLEKRTAHHVDCFTTVSEITAAECKQLLEKEPDIVTPNGFEKNLVPSREDYYAKRLSARRRLIQVAMKLTGHPIDDNAFLISTSGRYEYRNKGIDVFIDTMNRLRKNEIIENEVVAFIMVPAWVYEARADLKYVLEHDTHSDIPLQTPFITHWLNNMAEDRIMDFICSSGFTNAAGDKVKIIFVPCYLDGRDGIFNMSYYDLLVGMDATVFASYYEPWGYTPHESMAYGVPTITTDLAGFGMWAKGIISGNDIGEGMAVVHRSDDNYFELVESIASHLVALQGKDRTAIRQRCFDVAARAEWKEFIRHYYLAFDKALENKCI